MKFRKNDVVWVKLRTRPPFQIKVLEKVEGRPFYRLDWGSCGFDPLMNSVKISERALYESRTDSETQK